MRERGGRNTAVVDLTGVTEDIVDSHRALSSSGMGQHQLAGHIADSPEVGYGLTARQHSHAVVDGHKSAVGFNTQSLKVEPFAAGHPARGHQHRIDLQSLNGFTGLHINQFDQCGGTGLDRLGQYA